MPEGLLAAADAALYKAKHLGRNQIAASLLLKAPGERMRELSAASASRRSVLQP
jgi:hypothetical protein